MSNFIVSARKYRPRHFDEVVGQEHVSETLRNALKTNQVAHAFLFTGPRGVGKTTMARILAQVLNCEHPTDDFKACNECTSCKAFNENASFNIIELDAASNNSVEHIRSLIEQVRFAPQQGKYKVFIIDEVHMLSSQAFNAFLKTLEEPPPYAIFILATTEKHKILPTILSRCQIFDFRQIQVQDIEKHLAGIAKKEKIKADKPALNIIARKADGALRDALSIFDRMAIAGGGHITTDLVVRHLHILDHEFFFQLVDAALIEDTATILRHLDRVIKQGFTPAIVLSGLLDHLRNLFVAKESGTRELLDVGSDLHTRFAKQAQHTPLNFLLSALSIANHADARLKETQNKRLHVELALIKIAFSSRATTPENLPQKKNIAEPVPITGNSHRAQPSNIETNSSDPAPTPPPAKPDKNESPKVEEPPAGYDDSTANQSPAGTHKPDPAPTPPPAKPDKNLQPTVRISTAESDDKPANPAADATNGHSDAATDLNAWTLDAFGKLAEADWNARKQNTAQLDEESLQRAWKAYLENKTKPTSSVRQVMDRVKLSIEGHVIHVRIGMRFDERTIREETGLMDFLRQELNSDQLSLLFELDPKLAPKEEESAKKKTLTKREKFDLIKQANPEIDNLLARFGAKIVD